MADAVSSPSDQRARWLDAAEMRFWRAWILSTTLLENRLNRDLQEGHGISHTDYGVLVVLSEQEGRQMRMTALAGFLALSKSRLSHQVSRLEKAGLVRREGCESDGRGVLACLTPAGHELLTRAAPTHVTGVRKYVVDMLSAEEQASAAEFLERVATRLREAG